MGRHSAPDDDRDEAPPAATAYAVTLAPGRHITGDEVPADDDAGRPPEPGSRPVDAMTDTDVALPVLLSGAETEPLPADGAGTAETADTTDTAALPTYVESTPQAEIAPTAASAEPAEPADAANAGKAAKPTKPAKAPKPPKPRRESGTRADLRLLREQPALRLRCSLGLVLPFVALAFVLMVIGRPSSYLLWVWIPAIVAGVTVGSLLDLAHRKRRAAPPEKPENQETADSAV